MWKTAGEQLGTSNGSGGDTFHVSFAPVINGGSGQEIKSVLEEQRLSFEQQFNRMMQDKSRTAFN
jgi:hypothetical protein